jgi:peptide/nickel transport system ATP-binding protein
MSAENTQNLIELQDLKKYFKVSDGYLHAVDGVTLTIGKGRTLGVVGESGCGKSTLGRAILRLHEPTGGKVFFEGKDMSEYSKKEMRVLRRQMQIIFQDPYSSLNPRMSVQEIIAEPMIVNKMYPSRNEIYKNTERLMDTVGLAARLATAYPHELDGGRRQRIGVARALSLDPRFIVCDEPVSALDVSIQAQILNLLKDLQDRLNLTYMFITHDLSVVRYISDDIAVMYLGKCVEKAPSNELFKNPVHPYTKALLSAIPVPSIEGAGLIPEPIKGELSSPVNPKPGCRFAPRCPQYSAVCAEGDVPLKDLGGGHFAACRIA